MTNQNPVPAIDARLLADLQALGVEVVPATPFDPIPGVSLSGRAGELWLIGVGATADDAARALLTGFVVAAGRPPAAPTGPDATAAAWLHRQFIAGGAPWPAAVFAEAARALRGAGFRQAVHDLTRRPELAPLQAACAAD